MILTVVLSASLITVAALLGVATRSLIRQIRAEAAELRAAIIGRDMLIERRDRRIADLEHQIQIMHSKGITTDAPAPAPEPPPPPLDPALSEFLDGIDDTDARDEFEALARHRLASGLEPDAVLAELMS